MKDWTNAHGAHIYKNAKLNMQNQICAEIITTPIQMEFGGEKKFEKLPKFQNVKLMILCQELHCWNITAHQILPTQMKFQYPILAKPISNQLIHKVCTFIFQLGMSQPLFERTFLFQELWKLLKNHLLMILLYQEWLEPFMYLNQILWTKIQDPNSWKSVLN